MIESKLKTATLVFLAGITASGPSAAELIESVEYKYYVISPHHVSQIKPELMRHSPIHDGSGTFNGRTDWYINWRYQASQSRYGCQLKNFTTNVHVIYTLPALSENVRDEKTIEVFNRFNKALTAHEHNHGKNGLTAAREIEKNSRLMQYNDGKPVQCRQLTRQIEAMANATVSRYTQADRDYDQNTSNGLTEGAVIY